MSRLLDKVSKPELAALISDYWRLDNDLVSCIVHERPFDDVWNEVAKMIAERLAKSERGLLPGKEHTLPAEVHSQVRALIHGYVYGKEAGRVQ
jgi:hypothetical protein